MYFTRIFMNQKTFFVYYPLVIRISVTHFLWKSCKSERLHKGILLSQKTYKCRSVSFQREISHFVVNSPVNVVLQLEMCVGNEVAH